jgi:hypothetical protein
LEGHFFLPLGVDGGGSWICSLIFGVGSRGNVEVGRELELELV